MLLDTHAVILWRSAGRGLSARAAREVARARSILLSPISCWEIAVLQQRDRVRLDRPIFEWIADLYQEDGVEPAPLTPQAAAAAALFGPTFGGDPADRFLYATARELAVPLVTKDRRLREFARAAGDLRTIW